MKTEQEQIEEIAFSSCVVPHNTIQFLSNYMQKESIKFESCRVCEFYNSCQRIKDIKNLYKAGYRKQSDTAREILQYLYEKMGNVQLSDTELVLYLATQYGVEVEE